MADVVSFFEDLPEAFINRLFKFGKMGADRQNRFFEFVGLVLVILVILLWFFKVI